MLDRRLHRRLRRDLGLSYRTQAIYEGRDARYATVTAFADTLPDKHADVTREFVDILIDLASIAINEEELTTVRSLAERRLHAPQAARARMVHNAERMLLGLLPRSADQTRQDLVAVTADDVVALGRQALGTALAVVPHGQGIGRAGFVAAPAGSTEVVTGEAYQLRNTRDAKRRLVFGPDGVSLVDELSVATVRYSECTAMLAWPDGALLLFAPDAVMVRLEPRLWELPAARLAALDAAIPAYRTVHMSSRAEESIPAPPDPPPAARPIRRTPKGRQVAPVLIGTALWLTAAALIMMYAPGLTLALVVGTGMAIRTRRKARARR